MSRGLMAGLLGAVVALAGSEVIGDGPRRGGRSQPKQPRVNPPGSKARRKKRRAELIRKRGRFSARQTSNAKPQTKLRRERADGMLYLASIGKPTSGRQWRRLRKAIRREIGE